MLKHHDIIKSFLELNLKNYVRFDIYEDTKSIRITYSDKIRFDKNDDFFKHVNIKHVDMWTFYIHYPSDGYTWDSDFCDKLVKFDSLQISDDIEIHIPDIDLDNIDSDSELNDDNYYMRFYNNNYYITYNGGCDCDDFDCDSECNDIEFKILDTLPFIKFLLKFSGQKIKMNISGRWVTFKKDKFEIEFKFDMV